MPSEDEVRELKRRHSAHLLSQPGVCGVGVGKDDKGHYVLTVHLDTDDPEVRQRLPSTLEGHPIKFVHSGPFRKFSP